MNTILEMILPVFYKWLNLTQVYTEMKKNLTSVSIYNALYLQIWTRSGTIKKDGQRWLRDLKLVEWGPRSLFGEYLEMGKHFSRIYGIYGHSL